MLSDKDVTVVDSAALLLTDKRLRLCSCLWLGKQFDYARKVEKVLLPESESAFLPVVRAGRFKSRGISGC